jgi:hypothetical protein
MGARCRADALAADARNLIHFAVLAIDDAELALLEAIEAEAYAALPADHNQEGRVVVSTGHNVGVVTFAETSKAYQGLIGLGLDPLSLTLKNWTSTVQKGVSTWPTRQSSDRRQSASTG